ncbi:TPA: heavy metal translocating P-type ATPase [Burkholderia territorii]|uniref:heavy metal translocating P-type ATPase n=1 Tax=Burkholderia territorii TaxID=1503055 RepID=UPI0011CB170C|nr:heavy metal translocating P-type ATPase [Burkholderia territorii]TXG04360.1 heavy metal translocating P-type ATPase [Burkholderia territorii]HDR8859696.1 heavy metal translocating P-type ATPase [Burkholderia territorii]HDR8865616.1 heavy metal translocating P-type ATPase [Burkholderia territorii]HDR8872094.1 heavy metal translocating P-type ATPase [Burkholderia territorii]HDR8878507.1 heavy metal translocating P-type ATPase [Burkholderia territorii]
MSRIRWSIDLALLILAAVALAGGGMCAAFGLPSLARVVWLLGTLPVLLALTVSLARAMARRQAGIDVLAWLAIALAIALDETLAATVIALMLASGRTLERYAQDRAQREMTALLGRAPRHATRFEHGEWRSVAVETLVPGDRLLVRSGECVPVDGTLTDDAELDESMLTGESSTQRRCAGETACSGVVNAGTPFEMVARTTAGDSTFAGIVRMVERAQRERSPSVRVADRYAAFFVLASLLVAGIAWLLAGDVARALAVLVVATPCPLILAVPVAIVSGMSRCSKRGILVKGGGALERLAQTTILFFDKTGTLTGGRARIVAIECGEGVRTDDVLRFAASLAQASGHVISDALTVAARERRIDLSPPSGVVETAGEGVTGRVDARTVTIGKFAYVCACSTAAPWSDAFLEQVGNEGGAAVFVGVDGVMIGAIRMADQVRLETPRALRLLKREGVKRLVMLTGDRRDIACAVGELLGVTDVRAEQTPADKLAAIQAARSEGVTIMVGDGVNDAPALAAADVGIAMGARGAAASSEAADVVLLVDRLDRLVDAIRIARRSRRIAIESVVAGMSLSIVAMTIAAAGFLQPIAGAVIQEVIDIVVIVNALRALRVRPGQTDARLTDVDVEQLKREHAALSPLLDEIRNLADRMPQLSGAAIGSELAGMIDSLDDRLLPHERADDLDVYARLAPLLGGEDPLAAMSGAHREIFTMVRSLRQMAADLPRNGTSAVQVQAIQRLLYGLEAIVRLHCAQEEELFHAVGADA